MRRSLAWFCLAVSACAVAVPEAANAQITPDLPSISLKSGETLEIADLWYCRPLPVPVEKRSHGGSLGRATRNHRQR